MDADGIADLFRKHEDEYLRHEQLEESECKRPDLRAFLLLDRLVPGKRRMVSAAEHDEIWLDVSLGELAEAASEADVIMLLRLGVQLDDYGESLSMYV